jgi:predicted transcriptional regulator
MTTITIPLSEDRLQRLKELATEAKVAPEELVRLSVEEWLARPKADFARAADYVVQKNAELYRRLAQ